jgi:hypothetical protein
MSLRKRSAIGVCLAIIAGGLGMVRPAHAQTGPGTEPAPRAQAVDRVVQEIKKKAVRPAEEARFRADAERIVARMTDAQVEALAGADAAPAAAVAVAAGPTPGDPRSDLLFVPVPPCRVIDTRLNGGTKFNPNEVRDFEIAGTANFEAQGGKAGGCGIPLGGATPVAAAVMLNFVAVNPESSGDLRAWEFGQSVPLAAVLNYDNLGPFFAVANGIVVPVSGVSSTDKDLSIRADFGRTHVVVDVTGYFTRFPVENFQGGLKSTVLTHDFTTLIDLSDGACKDLNSCTITTTVPGTVIVEAWGQFVANHSGGTLDSVSIGIEAADTVACNAPGSVNSSNFDVPAALGSNLDVDFTVSHGRSFAQAAGVTQAYHLSGKMVSGASMGDSIENSRLICTFIPD